MTIQSRMNKEYTTPTQTGLAPSEWAANLSNKNSKERSKTQNLIDHNPLPGSHAHAAKHLCHRVGLSLALAPRKNPEPEIPGSHNHRGNVSNLKITQYRFRSSLKI
jgi:hypothetical protein